jgi:hypothetical protein
MANMFHVAVHWEVASLTNSSAYIGQGRLSPKDDVHSKVKRSLNRATKLLTVPCGCGSSNGFHSSFSW